MKAGFLWGKTEAIYLLSAADYAIDSQAVKNSSWTVIKAVKLFGRYL